MTKRLKTRPNLVFCTLFLLLTQYAAAQTAEFEGSYDVSIMTVDKRIKTVTMHCVTKGARSTSALDGAVDSAATMTHFKIFTDRKAKTKIMLFEQNGEKKGIKMSSESPNADGTNAPIRAKKLAASPPKVTETEETKTIDGHLCKKTLVQTDRFSVEAWVAQDLKYKLLGSGGEADAERELFKGTVIELSRTDKSSKKTVLRIKNINAFAVPETEFNTDAYQIMVMPSASSEGE